MLPTDAKERKAIPVYSGFIKYFPDAIAEVAKISKAGNDQHNPGKPLHWDRSKSGDELDALARHLLDGASATLTLDERIEEAAARSWRSMADLQKLCERREQNGEAMAESQDWFTEQKQKERAEFARIKGLSSHELMRELRLKDEG